MLVETKLFFLLGIVTLFSFQGTPALFLIQLIFNNNLLECGVADEK